MVKVVDFYERLLFIGFALVINAMLAHPQSVSFVASTRWNLNGNATCPVNCTCFSQRSSSPELVRGQEFETLAPKKIVQCDQISIDNIRDIFASMPDDVTSFTLRHAELTSLTDICCMEDLESLDLSHNRISDLIVYLEFEKLTSLNLQHNALRILRKDEFISFPNVEMLNIDNNDIEVIDQESFRLMRLQRLQLSQNKVTYVNARTFRYASNMEMLNLSGNLLASIHARNFYFSRKLRSLDLSQNQLTHIDEYGFEPLYRLEELNLSFNNLTTVPSLALRILTSLKLLILDGNPISILENGSVSQLPSLETIRLDQMNDLTMVLNGAFVELPRLRIISLANCKRLQYLSPIAFQADSLKELYLTNSGLMFLPTSLLGGSLEKVDFSGNPLDCDCIRQRLSAPAHHQIDALFQSVCPAGHANRAVTVAGGCNPTVVPSENANWTRSIGVPLSLYCAVIGGNSDSDDSYSPVWTLPNGQKVLAGQRLQRFQADQEHLRIDYLLQEDGGRYACSVMKVRNGTASDVSDSNSLYVDLYLEIWTSVIIPIEISAYHVTWRWTHALSNEDQTGASSAHHRPLASLGDSKLMFKSDQDKEFIYIDLPSLWERYTVNRLRPDTNYSFCLVFARDDVALYKYCTSLRTEKAHSRFGVSLNYSLIALVAVSITAISALFLARCMHKRLHIWQEEKYRGRMQESMSAQGFLSSFESLTSGSLAAAAATSVTFENRSAFDTIFQPEEAETGLSVPADLLPQARSSRLSCRKATSARFGRKKAPETKYASTGIVETHAAA